MIIHSDCLHVSAKQDKHRGKLHLIYTTIIVSLTAYSIRPRPFSYTRNTVVYTFPRISPKLQFSIIHPRALRSYKSSLVLCIGRDTFSLPPEIYKRISMRRWNATSQYPVAQYLYACAFPLRAHTATTSKNSRLGKRGDADFLYIHAR